MTFSTTCNWADPVPALQAEVFSGDAEGGNEGVNAVVFDGIGTDLACHPGLRGIDFFSCWSSVCILAKF